MEQSERSNNVCEYSLLYNMCKRAQLFRTAMMWLPYTVCNELASLITCKVTPCD